jgi:hypothetical protein
MAFYENESYLFGSDEVFTVPSYNNNISNFYYKENDIIYDIIYDIRYKVDTKQHELWRYHMHQYNIRYKVDTKQHELWRYHMHQYHKKLFNKKYNKTNSQTFFPKQFSKKFI